MTDLNVLRSLAGLPNMPGIHKVIEQPVAEKKDEEKPAFPENIMAFAAKAEGKTGDDLAAEIDKVFKAGVAEGKAAAEAEAAKAAE